MEDYNGQCESMQDSEGGSWRMSGDHGVSLGALGDGVLSPAPHIRYPYIEERRSLSVVRIPGELGSC